jgi:hypothetical protein
MHLFHFANKLILLLDQNPFSGLIGMVASLNQLDIFCQHFHRKPSTSHTFDEINPLHISLVVVTDSTFIPVDSWDKANAFIVKQGIGINIVSFTYF